MVCEICGGQLVICPTNNDYHKCENCKTQVLINRESFESEFYEGFYLKDDDQGVLTFLKNNKNHYTGMINNQLSRNTEFNAFLKEIIENKVTDCYCYGGGFPHFENFLPIDNVHIYDFIADKYEEKIDLYFSVYDKKNIMYIPYDIKKGIEKVAGKTITTFIHILEHFPVKDIKDILKDAVDVIDDGSYIIIYQPNADMARNSSWCHYINQHVTFLTLSTFIKLIEDNHPNMKVMYKNTYSDDLMIILKKC